MAKKPQSRPQWDRSRVEAVIRSASLTDKVVLVGVRGYYQDTMGKPDQNDRGIYDDAIFLLSPEAFASFNANVDPSVYRMGIATLNAGTWRYRIGTHGLSKPPALRYEALVQAAEVTVKRDKGKKETGMFGINIHRGGNAGTSSLGCQTIVPEQWQEFIGLVKKQLMKHAQGTVPYLLVEEQG